RPDGKRGRRRALAEVEVPDVGLRRGAHGDRLGRVDRAAAADRQHEAETLRLAQADSFIDQAEARVRLDAAEFHPFDAGLAQRSGDAIVETARLDAAAAVVQ